MHFISFKVKDFLKILIQFKHKMSNYLFKSKNFKIFLEKNPFLKLQKNFQDFFKVRFP